MHFSLLDLRRLLPVALLALAVSCGPAKTTDGGETVIDSFSTTTNASFFQDVFSDIRAVPLQTGDFALGRSSALSLKDKGGKYILADTEANAVYTFDHTGKLQGRILKVGRGPGEYTQLQDCEYADGKYIVLADGGHVIEYDGQGGLLREFTLERDLMDLALVDGQPVLLASRYDGGMEGESDKILVCDADYQPVSSFCPQGFQLFNYASSLVPVAGEAGTFLYLEPLSAQLRKCNKEGLLSTYRIDFKGKEMPEAILQSEDYEQILSIMTKTPDIYCCSKAYENSDYLLLALEHLSSGDETRRGQWLVKKSDGSSRVEYFDYNGDVFAFLGTPLMLTEQDEVVYIVDTSLFASAVAGMPELTALGDCLDASESESVLLICKIGQ